MKKLIIFTVAILFGLSFTFCAQAQDSKKRETLKDKTERLKKEKATKDSTTTAFYKQEIERLQQEKDNQEKLITDLQAQADAKAEVENKLANAEKTNFELITVASEKSELEKQLAEKNKENEDLKGRVNADSANKALLRMKIQEMQIEADKNAKVEASVETSPVVIAPVNTKPTALSSVKKSSAKKKKK